MTDSLIELQIEILKKHLFEDWSSLRAHKALEEISAMGETQVQSTESPNRVQAPLPEQFDSASPARFEVSAVDNEAVMINLCEELADMVKEGRPYLGKMAEKLRPYLRQPEAVSESASIGECASVIASHLNGQFWQPTK